MKRNFILNIDKLYMCVVKVNRHIAQIYATIYIKLITCRNKKYFTNISRYCNCHYLDSG